VVAAQTEPQVTAVGMINAVLVGGKPWCLPVVQIYASVIVGLVCLGMRDVEPKFLACPAYC